MVTVSTKDFNDLGFQGPLAGVEFQVAFLCFLTSSKEKFISFSNFIQTFLLHMYKSIFPKITLGH